MRTVSGWLAAAVLGCGASALAAAAEPPGVPQAAPAVAVSEADILEYDRLLHAADRYVSEGDYPAALDQLQQASRIRPGDARFHEKLAVACDADRQPAAAFDNFEKAGNLYLATGELEHAARMLEYLRASGRDKQRADALALRLNAARHKR